MHYTYKHNNQYVCMYVCVYIRVCVYIHACTRHFMHDTYKHNNQYVYMYVCVCVCMCVCEYIHACTSLYITHTNITISGDEETGGGARVKVYLYRMKKHKNILTYTQTYIHTNRNILPHVIEE
jgi:hypothetical protein